MKKGDIVEFDGTHQMEPMRIVDVSSKAGCNDVLVLVTHPDLAIFNYSSGILRHSTQQFSRMDIPLPYFGIDSLVDYKAQTGNYKVSISGSAVRSLYWDDNIFTWTYEIYSPITGMTIAHEKDLIPCAPVSVPKSYQISPYSPQVVLLKGKLHLDLGDLFEWGSPKNKNDHTCIEGMTPIVLAEKSMETWYICKICGKALRKVPTTKTEDWRFRG